MGNVIPLDEKLDLLKNKKEALDRKRKIQAVRNVFRCVRCAFKCEKCGTGIEKNDESQQISIETLKIPYNFCNSCRDEYLDYINHLKGKTDAENYWYNDSWAELWRRWIDYQSSMDNYLKSKEFKLLLSELKDSGSDGEEV